MLLNVSLKFSVPDVFTLVHSLLEHLPFHIYDVPRPKLSKWKLFQIWIERAESPNKLPACAVPFTFHDMDIFPSSSQVHEMLQCASECSKHQNGDYLTFGEFCVYASELKSCSENRVSREIPLSKRTIESKCSLSRKSSTFTPSKYEVFLGGSCNPTTWRTDVAIPALKKMGITYYNPQVAHWGPELIELENEAKQHAEVMFFVIDNQTRSIASMIEVAHIAGVQRKLILIINEFECPGSVVMGERITEKEFKELRHGQRFLQDLVERQSIPVFQNLQHALACCGRLLQENIWPQELTRNDAAHPVKLPYLHIGDKLIKLREVFDDLDTDNTGKITLADVCMAFRILNSQELLVDNLNTIITNHKSIPLNDTELKSYELEEIEINFDEFCCIMTEFKNQMDNGTLSFGSMVKQVLRSAVKSFSQLIDRVLPKVKSTNNSNILFASHCRDIYLGGSGQPSSWREDIAIPLLKKKGLTYFTPLDGQWSDRLIPLEATAIENSRVLLFIITKDTRALAQMIVAAHYVGLQCEVVLCIQYLEDDTTIEEEKLSNQGVKDYNRGRVYLSDLANRAGIPVFDNITEAVTCAIEKCCKIS